MRALCITLGSLAITVYAVLGALLMSDWALVAGSGEPIDATIRAMRAAGQDFQPSAAPVFAGFGVVLAIAWAVLVWHPRIRIPAWASLAVWAAIVAGGAPAYFWASFSALNGLGDTYVNWNVDAVWSLERPLYATSGLAALLAVALLGGVAIRSVVQARRSSGVPVRDTLAA